MIPPDKLPYVSGRGPVDEVELSKMFAEASNPVPFTLNRNLRVYVSSVNCKLQYWSKTVSMTVVSKL